MNKINPYEQKTCPFCKKLRRVCLFSKIVKPVPNVKYKNICHLCIKWNRNNYNYDSKTYTWKKYKASQEPKPRKTKSIKMYSGLTNEQRKRLSYMDLSTYYTTGDL